MTYKLKKEDCFSIDIKEIINPILKNMSPALKNDIELKHQEVVRVFNQNEKKKKLTFIRNNFGYIYYYVCPECSEKCKILYIPLGKNNFACSECHDLDHRKRNSTLLAKSIVSPIQEIMDIKKRITSDNISTPQRNKLLKKLEYMESNLSKLQKDFLDNF